MTTEHHSFIGIPVQGDITRPSGRVKQRPIEELTPLLKNVLGDETVIEFGWQQYTPYFNDGDPCVFSADGFWLRTDTDDEDAETYDLAVACHPSLGSRRCVYNHETKKYEYLTYEGPDEERYDRCLELRRAIMSNAFQDVLLDAFGDHASVTVRADGIEVEFYEHD